MCTTKTTKEELEAWVNKHKRPDKMTVDELADYFQDLLEEIGDQVFTIECALKDVRENMDCMEGWIERVQEDNK